MAKFKVTVQVTDYKTITVNAKTAEEAMAKADERLTRAGMSTIAFRVEEQSNG
jgi:hypothetical protein